MNDKKNTIKNIASSLLGFGTGLTIAGLVMYIFEGKTDLLGIGLALFVTAFILGVFNYLVLQVDEEEK